MKVTFCNAKLHLIIAKTDHLAIHNQLQFHSMRSCIGVKTFLSLHIFKDVS